MSDVAPPSKFYGIDVVRGVATCMVALAHASYRQIEPRFGGVLPFGGVLENLFICVDFFFVLSGFLIAWVHWKHVGDTKSVGYYFKRRLSRIYPVYWAVLILVLVGRLVQPQTGNPVDVTPFVLITSFLVIPNGGPTILGVAWTLYFEISCYIVFATLIYSKRLGLTILAVWVWAILVTYAYRGDYEFPISFFLSPYNLQFIAGIGLALIIRNYTIPLPRTLAVIGGALFLGVIFSGAAIFLGDSPLTLRMLTGTFACMVIGGIVQAERSGLLVVPVWMRNLGAASYSIYLVHTVVQSPLMKYGWAIYRLMIPEVRIFAIAAVTIAAGYIFHLVVERPLTAWVQKAMFGETKTAVPKKPIVELQPLGSSTSA